MVKRILVAVDGSAEAVEALTFAATEWPDADLTALHVINPADSTTGAEGGFPGAVDQWYDSATQRGERILREATDAVDRAVDTRLEVGRPTATILAVANGEKAVGDDAEPAPFDHVVLASQGRTGLSRVLLGSVAEGVVRRAEMPVTVVR
ncbi:universal stress protein [Halorubrum pallidum]